MSRKAAAEFCPGASPRTQPNKYPARFSGRQKLECCGRWRRAYSSTLGSRLASLSLGILNQFSYDHSSAMKTTRNL